MRAVILFASVVAAIGILWWQAPEMVPVELRHALISAGQQAVAFVSTGAKKAPQVTAAKAPAPAAEAGATAQVPLWPDPLEQPIRKPFPIVPVAVAAAIAFAGLGGGIWLAHRRRIAARHAMPEWLLAARQLALATNDKNLRLKQCDLIERHLVADMKQRGTGALARAHQLDLYWRYVGRSNLLSKSFVKGVDLDRWRTISKQTLEAIALPPTARNLSAFRQAQDTLWALEQGDARELKRYYGALEAQTAEYEAAWNRASGAVRKLVIDQPALLDAMETLRQLNRSMAKQTAAMVGDLEISVRAAS